MNTEDQTTPNQTDEDQTNDGPTEKEILDALKQKAKVLKISHSPNIGVDALRAKITEAMAEPEKDETVPQTTAVPNTVVSNELPPRDDSQDAQPTEAAVPLTRGEIRAKQRKEQMRLVRVRIANMNPSKSDLGGEIFTVRTKYLGIVKKFVPYGEATDDGYHIPYIIYEQLKSRKFLQTKIKKSKNSAQRIPQTRWVPEFSLEVLPDLTPEELKKLANQQAAAAGMADD